LSKIFIYNLSRARRGLNENDLPYPNSKIFWKIEDTNFAERYFNKHYSEIFQSQKFQRMTYRDFTSNKLFIHIYGFIEIETNYSKD
jgi:hypothetical protein